MITIVLASQKGGAGKTTLSGHLAVEARGSGKIAVIDLDPQGSLTEWWNAREEDTPTIFSATTANLKTVLKQLAKQGFDYVFIDTQPRATAEIRDTLRLAQMVIIPVTPSPHDLRAVGSTVELVAQAGRPMMFVVNNASQRARITSQAAVALSQHGTVSPVTLHHRTDFRSSMSDGRTVGELDSNSKSASEVKELWSYVLTRLTMEQHRAAAS